MKRGKSQFPEQIELLKASLLNRPGIVPPEEFSRRVMETLQQEAGLYRETPGPAAADFPAGVALAAAFAAAGLMAFLLAAVPEAILDLVYLALGGQAGLVALALLFFG